MSDQVKNLVSVYRRSKMFFIGFAFIGVFLSVMLT